MILAAFRDAPYKIVLILHLLSVIVGFGAVFLNGVYYAKARSRGGSAGGGALRINLEVTEIGEKVIYLVPVFGIALVFMSGKVLKFDQAWVGISLVLYIVAVVVAATVLLPGQKQAAALQEELGALPAGDASTQGKVAQLDALGKKMAAVGGSLDLLIVIVLILMVVKPGGPNV